MSDDGKTKSGSPFSKLKLEYPDGEQGKTAKLKLTLERGYTNQWEAESLLELNDILSDDGSEREQIDFRQSPSGETARVYKDCEISGPKDIVERIAEHARDLTVSSKIAPAQG